MRRLLTFTFLLALAVFVWGSWAGGVQSSSENADEKKILELGTTVYRTQCMVCHGQEGKSPIKEMNLANGEWKQGDSLEIIEKTIAKGVTGTAMLGFEERLTEEQISAVAKYVRTLSKPKAE